MNQNSNYMLDKNSILTKKVEEQERGGSFEKLKILKINKNKISKLIPKDPTIIFLKNFYKTKS